jgi:hypothetical protein
VRSLVQQIQIGDAQILVWLNRTAIVSSVMPGAPPKPTDCVPAIEPLVLLITASLCRAGKGVRLVIGNGTAKAIDEGLASLIARAMATRNMLLAGPDDSIDAMALRLGVRRDYLAVLVRLSYLSPENGRRVSRGGFRVGSYRAFQPEFMDGRPRNRCSLQLCSRSLLSSRSRVGVSSIGRGPATSVRTMPGAR